MNIEKFVDEALGNEMYQTRLPSGMTATFIPLNSEVKVQMIHLYTRFGSIDAKFFDPLQDKEVEVEDGTAHFLEHCAFYDPNGNDALKWFGQKGVAGNAWTSFDHTTYYFHSTGKNLRRDMDFLISFVTTPYFTDKVVDKEKGVIDQEVAMYADRPNNVLFENLQKALLKQHPMRRSIGGDRETIKRITKEYLQSAYNTFYHPSNLNLVMFVPSTDGIENALKHFKLAADITSKKGFTPKMAPQFVYIDEPAEVNQRKIEAKHKVPEPMMLIGFKGKMGMDGSADERLKENVVNDLLINTVFSNSSEALYELGKKGIIRQNEFGGFNQAGRGFNIFGVYGSIDDTAKFEEGVIRMIKEQVNGKMSKDLFDIVKKAAINQRAEMFELEEPHHLTSAVIHSLAAGLNPMNYMKSLLSVTYEDVLEAGKKYLDTENYAMSILLPQGQ